MEESVIRADTMIPQEGICKLITPTYVYMCYYMHPLSDQYNSKGPATQKVLSLYEPRYNCLA